MKEYTPQNLFHLLLIGVTAFLLLVDISQSHSTHDNDHDHDTVVASVSSEKKKTPVYKDCGSHTKTEYLKSIDETYKNNHEASRQHGHDYVNMMKSSKNRAFNKKVKKMGKKMKKSKELKRNLLQYADDDEDDYYNAINNSPVILVPIVYHVLYSNDKENLSDDQLESQTTVLNEDFRGINEEILDNKVAGIFSDRVGDSKIQFYMNTTYRVSISSADSICFDESKMKLSSAGGSDGLDPSIFMNVWICNISSEGLLGYAYQPCLLDTSFEYKDGLVLGSDNVGSYKHDTHSAFYFGSSLYNEGRTGTHEIGHYLDLDHIWGDSSSCSSTDYVADTPTAYSSNFGCPDNTTNSCDDDDEETGTDLRDMYENYMDYTDDRCMFMFTEEQAWRMRSVLSASGCRSKMYYNGAILTDDQTLMPSSQETDNGGSVFSCNDGCPIVEDWVDDGYCDCACCEDESAWTCDTCSSEGCPASCGDYVECDGTRDASSSATNCNVTVDHTDETISGPGTIIDTDDVVDGSGSNSSNDGAVSTQTIIVIVCVCVIALSLIGIVIGVKYYRKSPRTINNEGLRSALLEPGSNQGNIVTA